MQKMFFCNKERWTQCWVTWLTINLLFPPYFTLQSHQGKFPKTSLCQSPMIFLSLFICAGMGWKLHWLHQSEAELWLHGCSNTAWLLFHISLAFILHSSGEHCFWIAFFSPDLFFPEHLMESSFPSPEGSLRRDYHWRSALPSFLSNVYLKLLGEREAPGIQVLLLGCYHNFITPPTIRAAVPCQKSGQTAEGWNLLMYPVQQGLNG